MNKRVLFIGQNWHGSNATSLMRAFRFLGCDVQDIDEYHYFPEWNSIPMRAIRRVIGRRIVHEFSNQIKNLIDGFKPELTFVFKGAMVTRSVLEYIHQKGSLLFNFYPDWDFGKYYSQMGNDFTLCMREYDIVFTPKSYHIGRFQREGVRRVEFLPYAYDPWCHFRVEPTLEERSGFACDVVFIGSWEENRAEVLESLINKTFPYTMKVWGNQWNRLSKNSVLRPYVQFKPAIGLTQAKIFASSKIALAFIKSPDLHSSRTFEIPAYGAFMLAERSTEHLEFFHENQEIVCFADLDELRYKIQYYLEHDRERQEIARAGYQKVTTGGHSYVDRANQILEIYNAVR